MGSTSVEATPIAAHLKAVRGGSLSYEMEWKGRTFQVRVDPLRDPGKLIIGTVGILVDITDRKQAVAELKARERQQAVVASLGLRALAGLDVSTLMQECADAVCQTLGADFCEVLEFLPDEGAFRWRAGSGWRSRQLDQSAEHAGASQAGYTLRTGQPVIVRDLRQETRFRPSKLLREHGAVSGLTTALPGKRGPLGVLGAYTTAQRAFSGDDLHFLQAVANVIAASTERHQGEEAQGRLVAILEATPDFVAIAGKDRRLSYVNRAGREVLGLRPEQDISTLTLDGLYPDDLRAAALAEGVTTAVSKGVWSGESTLLGRGGARVPVSQVLISHRAPGGQCQFLSTIARDISERQRLEEQLRQSQKMEAVGRLAGGVAHDFNNLLCVINGYAGFLLEQLPAGELLHEYAEQVHKAGERAASLTRQLLAFSRKQVLLPRTLNLNALVTEMDKLFRRLIGEDVALVTDLDPTLAPVRADAGQIEQVVMNLAVNARDAMPRGGKLTLATGNVTLTAEHLRERPEVSPGRYVLLSVTDTGCGMDEEVKAHLFEPFFTTKGVGKGTGLGLPTVYGIVKQSGGHIEVDSEPGLGTTVRVYLPALQESAARPEDRPAAPAGRAQRGGAETVLLVEDEEGVRSLARQILQGEGYTVLEAQDGLEALAVCEQYPGHIHLILTDAVMPNLGGSALVERATVLRPGTKVLFMSGFTDSALFRHGVLTGKVECLYKPFTPDALAQMVRQVLDGRAPLHSQEAEEARSALAGLRGNALCPVGGTP